MIAMKNCWKVLKQYVKKTLFPFYLFLDKKYYMTRFYRNIGINPLDENQKHVLISYITAPLEWNFGTEPARHTSLYESAIIIQWFLCKGYCVDVIHCEDVIHLKQLENYKYDFVFGFGEPFCVACRNNPDAKKIIYLTESAPEFSGKHEQERNDYLYARTGVQISLNRTDKYFKKEHMRFADYGILVGNAITMRSYSEYYPNLRISTIAPSGLRNSSFVFDEQKSLNKSVFVWFASSGIVHKGLDVLVEAFKGIPDAMLLICGMPEDEEWILGDYKKYKNIFNMGFVDVQSQKFLDMVDKACFEILPSASEGMSTSVLTCMRHGLIPVVTKECGITVDDCGFYLDDYHVEYLDKMIRFLMRQPDDKLKILRKFSYKRANQEYTLEGFHNRFQSALCELMN